MSPRPRPRRRAVFRGGTGARGGAGGGGGLGPLVGRRFFGAQMAAEGSEGLFWWVCVGEGLRMANRAVVTVWADPGRSTGWSVHRVEEKVLLDQGQVGSVARTWWRSGVFRHDSTSASVDSYLALCRAVWEKAGEEDVVVLGCEGFTLRMQSTDHWLLEPVRFLAVLRDRLRGTGVGVEVQSSSDAMEAITDARLKLWGLWKPGSDHGRDAQRHGLLFLRRYASQPELRERVGG